VKCLSSAATGQLVDMCVRPRAGRALKKKKY
jgi:hypothetical protein